MSTATCCQLNKKKTLGVRVILAFLKNAPKFWGCFLMQRILK